MRCLGRGKLTRMGQVVLEKLPGRGGAHEWDLSEVEDKNGSQGVVTVGETV